jgi:hypothetical protein
MNPSREDHLEAAKLAKAISSQLNVIDSFSTERRDVPANRIDINKFIARVVQPTANIPNNNRGYIPEDLVQKMVPDNTVYSKPVEVVQQIPEQISSPNVENVQVSAQPNAVKQINEQVITSDYQKSIDRIASAIEKFVDCYVKYNTIEDKEKILNE